MPFFKGTFAFLYIAFSIQTPHVYFIIADWEMASSPVALVQGANRGLGLAFVRILASRSSKVVATCRRPDQAEDLQKIPNVEILQVSSILESTMHWFLNNFFATVGAGRLPSCSFYSRFESLQIMKDYAEKYQNCISEVCIHYVKCLFKKSRTTEIDIYF